MTSRAEGMDTGCHASPRLPNPATTPGNASPLSLQANRTLTGFPEKFRGSLCRDRGSPGLHRTVPRTPVLHREVGQSSSPVASNDTLLHGKRPTAHFTTHAHKLKQIPNTVTVRKPQQADVLSHSFSRTVQTPFRYANINHARRTEQTSPE